MKILVVGANGFIGRAMVEHLRKSQPDAEIVGVVRQLPQTAVPADIRFATQLEPADMAFYLAGTGGIPESFADPAATFASTCTAGIDALEHARTLGIAQFVFASTCAVYPHGARAAQEHGALDLNSPYAKAKRMVELYGLTSAELTGQDFRVARLANVYGPSQARQLIHDVAQQAKGGGKVTLRSSGAERRDFIHVADAARALWTLATDGQPATITNIGSGNATPVRDVAAMICAQFGAELVAKPDLIADENANTPGSGDAYPDITSLLALGFRPEIELEAGLSETLEWMRTTT